MDNFSKPICLHPGFYIEALSDDRFILIGETQSFLLGGGHYRDLFVHIDGNKTILDIVFEPNDIRKQTMLLNAVEELIRKGLILTKNGQENEIKYYYPDFDSKSVTLPVSGEMLELRLLSGFEDTEGLVKWAKHLQVSRPAGIVVTDDYLDPRLKGIDHYYAQKEQPWLLIKPTGRRPLIGPWFTPGDRNAPCYHCLLSSLRHNQPVRSWLQRKHNGSVLKIPVFYEKNMVSKVLAVTLKPTQEFVGQNKTGCLLALDPDNVSFTSHNVRVFPQCPCCGDPGKAIKQMLSPVTIDPCPKTHITDGGVRAVTPSETIERLKPLISDITGVIGDLSRLPDHKEKGIPVFRSFFFKTPKSGHSPDNGSFIQTSLGKGMSEKQAKASALCESIERHAVQYQGNEPCVIFSPGCIEDQVILPHELAAFSEKQYQQFAEQQNPDGTLPYAVKKFHADIPIAWTQAWSLTDQSPLYVPLTYCYANTPFEEQCYSRFNSNGCAAGNTLEEAILQGFLELVERDAVAIWWYNKICRPPVAPDMLSKESLLQLSHTLADEWDYWVLDITHDFQIPVMAAVSRNKTDNTFRLGFGCHIDPVLACLRSLTELCQLIAVKNKGPAVFNFDRILEEPFLMPKENAGAKELSDFGAAVHADIKDDILYCVEKAARLGLTTLAVDYTRPDIPIRTARVIIPGLCHIWPQLGNIRLYKVPVVMGWRETQQTEALLNRHPLLI